MRQNPGFHDSCSIEIQDFWVIGDFEYFRIVGSDLQTGPHAIILATCSQS